MRKNLLDHRPTPVKNGEIESVYESGKITIIYPKRFSGIEKWVRDRIGGPEKLRRPLDKFTTFIWENCDGHNSIAEIIIKFDREFGEEVAPADLRVQKFIKLDYSEFVTLLLYHGLQD